MEINQIMQVREKKNKERATNKAYIGVELSNKAGEVVVLEIFWKQILCKIRMLPHHKSVPTFTPRYHLVRPLILHQLIRLRQERCRHRSLLQHFNLTNLFLFLFLLFPQD